MLIRYFRRGTSQVKYGSRTIDLVCWWDCRKDKRSGWDEWERTCACGQCQVRQGMRHDTWMTIVLGTQKMCNPELCSSWATRVRLVKCDHAVQLCTCFICGCTVHTPVTCLEVLIQATETGPNSVKKCSPIVRTWRMQIIQIARLPLGLVPRRRRGRSCLQVGVRAWRRCLQVSARMSVEPPTCVRVNVVKVFLDFKLLPFPLSYLLTARNISVFLLCYCQVLVVQSFAFSFLLSKIKSLIERKLSSSFRICCKTPIIRNLIFQLSLLCRCASPKRSCCTTSCVFLSTRENIGAFADVPCSACVLPGSTFFVVQKLRAELHVFCFSWSRIQGSRWRHGCSGRTLLDSAKTSYFFHSCNRFDLFPSKHCSQDIAVWKFFPKDRRSRCCSCRRSNPAILCWTCWSSASGSSPEGRIPYVCGSRTSRSTSWPCSRVLYPPARLLKEVATHGVVTSFSVTCRIAWWFPRWSCVLALWILLTILGVRF